MALLATSLLLSMAASAWAQTPADHAITIVVPEQPVSLDPCEIGQSHSDRILRQNISESLAELSPTEGTVIPRLATAWERLDKATWRYHLRAGVKFHDGTDFNADDVVATLKRVKESTIVCSVREKYFSALSVVAKKVDDQTVDITADPPSEVLPILMTTVAMVPEGTPLDQVVNKPIGTGPYRFVEWVPNERVVLEKFDGYWGGSFEVEKATYVFRSEAAIRAAMVAAGEADLTPVIAIQDATNPKTDFPYLNNESTRMRIDIDIPPLNDVRFRKALELALDKVELGKALLGPDVKLATQIVGPSINGNNPDIVPRPYDPELAKKLLAEAKADGVPVDKEITIYGRPDVHPNSLELLEAMMAMWADVGIKTKLVAVEIADYLKVLRKPFQEGRGPNLLQEQHGNEFGDAIFSVFIKYHTNGPQSPYHFPEVDKMIDDAAVAPTPEDRRKIYQQLFAHLYNDIAADVELFHMVGYARVGSRIVWKPNVRSNSEIQLQTIKFAK